MLPSHARQAQPRDFRAGDEPTEAGGVIEAWLEFETETGRGRGHLRLKDGRRLDAADHADELKGHEEPRAVRARWAPSTASTPGGGRGQSAAETRPPSSATPSARGADHRRRPGRDRARRAAAPARRADDRRRSPRPPGRSVASALQVAVPARPGLVRPPAVPQVPRELAGVLAQGQDRRLAGDVHAGDGAQLLGLDPRPSRAAYDEAGRRMGRAAATRRRATCGSGPGQLVLATGMSGKANRPTFPGQDMFRGEQHHSSAAPRPGRATPGSGAW